MRTFRFSLLLALMFLASAAHAQEAGIYICTDQQAKHGPYTMRISTDVLQFWNREGDTQIGWSANFCNRPTVECSIVAGRYVIIEESEDLDMTMRRELDPRTGRFTHLKQFFGREMEDVYDCKPTIDPATEGVQD